MTLDFKVYSFETLDSGLECCPKTVEHTPALVLELFKFGQNSCDFLLDDLFFFRVVTPIIVDLQSLQVSLDGILRRSLATARHSNLFKLFVQHATNLAKLIVDQRVIAFLLLNLIVQSVDRRTDAADVRLQRCVLHFAVFHHVLQASQFALSVSVMLYELRSEDRYVVDLVLGHVGLHVFGCIHAAGGGGGGLEIAQRRLEEKIRNSIAKLAVAESNLPLIECCQMSIYPSQISSTLDQQSITNFQEETTKKEMVLF